MSFFSGLKAGMHNFGQCIATLINTTLLFIVYIIGVGITAIIARLFRKKFLDLSLKKKSYWKTLNLSKKPLEEYYKQY